MWETIRGYLTFTRKERYGVLFLLVLISGLFVMPYFFRPVAGKADPQAYEKMKEGIRKFESRFADSSTDSQGPDRNAENKNGVVKYFSANFQNPANAALFFFDPNKINESDWKRLGLSARETRIILHYIEKGGRFRRAGDLKKLYGFQNSDYERLSPYVRIAESHENFPARPAYFAQTSYKTGALKKADSFFRENPFRPNSTFIHNSKKIEITDINQADSAAWSRLPGIGQKLASRIIHFREKLGGFYQVDQVGETFALPDSVFQKIKPCLRLNGISLNQIDLNSATKEILQSHPYIRWKMAKAIIDYREQHGGFHSVEELLQLAQMDSVKYGKLKPYLVTKP